MVLDSDIAAAWMGDAGVFPVRYHRDVSRPTILARAPRRILPACNGMGQA